MDRIAMLIEDGIQIIKFWFSIHRGAQKARFNARRSDILKQWKLSTVDALAQEKWDEFTSYKEAMFINTHSDESPWVIVNGNDKATARSESIRYLLSTCDYENKGSIGINLRPDSSVVSHFTEEMLVAKRASDSSED